METLDLKNIRDFEIEATVERLAKLINDKNANVEIKDCKNTKYNSYIQANKDGLLLLAADLLLAARSGSKENQYFLKDALSRNKSEKSIGYIQLTEDAQAVEQTKKLTLKDKFIGTLLLALLGLSFVLIGWII